MHYTNCFVFGETALPSQKNTANVTLPWREMVKEGGWPIFVRSYILSFPAEIELLANMASSLSDNKVQNTTE